MSEQRFAITTDQKPALVNLIRRLPAILTGRVPDEHGIAAGFRARIGYTLLSLIAPNFDELGRGGTGADGDRWPELSPEYLAYGRRFGPGEKSALKAAAGVPRGATSAPGGKDGLLTQDQLRLWRRVYADRLAWYEMRESDASAKRHAAAVAWIIVKAAGGKTKLEVYGTREVQILVDTGYLRGSLQPGIITESGPDATYQKPSGNGGDQQLFDISEASRVVLGSNVEYATCHHNAKSERRRRRLWPSTFPREWWDQILGAAISGLSRINELYR